MHELTLAAIEAAAAEAETAFHMDEDRFRLFYERTARKVWLYLARISGDPALADDLLQETYYRFLRARLAEENEAYLRNYLFRIATNLVRDHWRERRNQGAFVQPLQDAVEPAVDERTAERVQQQS
ncbi:MAG: RNA polymerase sigma factor, partial [Terriglobia bacterium]